MLIDKLLEDGDSQLQDPNEIIGFYYQEPKGDERATSKVQNVQYEKLGQTDFYIEVILKHTSSDA